MPTTIIINKSWIVFRCRYEFQNEELSIGLRDAEYF